MKESDWWKTMFDQKYWDTFLEDFTPERTRKEVDFTIQAVGLKPEDKILDLACGHGRHAIELAKKGLRITGLDYSMLFLEKAKSDAEDLNIKVDLVRGDMKELPFREAFDSVLMLYTVFGYFSDLQNQEVLHEVNRILKPCGRFFIDVISGKAVKSRFEREGEVEAGSGLLKIPRIFKTAKITVNEIEWYDPNRQLIHNHREWYDKGRMIEYDFFLRVYTMPQYEEFLHKAGFEIRGLWGDFDGNPHDSNGNFSTLMLASKNKNYLS